MKTITLHPASLAVGGLAASLLFLSVGFAQITTTPAGPQAQGPSPRPVNASAGRPAARDLVFMSEGDPMYTVPQGRYLVISGIGDRSLQGSISGVTTRTQRVWLTINGVTESFQIPNTGVMFTLTAGRSLPGGTTVELPIRNGSGDAQAILTGYLEDA